MPRVLLPHTSKLKPNKGNHKVIIATYICPPLTLTSSKERHHFPLIIRWSIWFSTRPFGEDCVNLCISRCWKSVPPMIKLFMLKNSTSLSPLSFIVLNILIEFYWIYWILLMNYMKWCTSCIGWEDVPNRNFTFIMCKGHCIFIECGLGLSDDVM